VLVANNAYVPVTLMLPDVIEQDDLNWAATAEAAAINSGILDAGNAVRYKVT
jgi:hypothetical protein